MKATETQSSWADFFEILKPEGTFNFSRARGAASMGINNYWFVIHIKPAYTVDDITWDARQSMTDVDGMLPFMLNSDLIRQDPPT